MFLPIGLFASLLSNARDEELASTLREIDRREDLRRAWSAHEAAVEELRAACTGPDACFLYLGDNTWDDFVIDGVSIPRPEVPATGPTARGYREAASTFGPGPHGFFATCAGRHAVSVRAGDLEATEAFVMYPGEAVLLRLDEQLAAWFSLDAAEARAIVDRYASSELALLDYEAWVGAARLATGRATASDAALAQVHTLAGRAIAAAKAGRTDESDAVMAAAGETLNGVPLSSFGAITSAFGYQAYELAGRGDVATAAAVVRVGLALLPGDATLSAVSGELKVLLGDRDAARIDLERAVARGAAGLDEAWRARASQALASLR